jgi:hypothetical protein
MLSVVILNVVVLSVIMLNIVAPDALRSPQTNKLDILLGSNSQHFLFFIT